MPRSSLDALTHELDVLRISLSELKEKADQISHEAKISEEITDRLDDLENIFLAVTEFVPAHAVEKARSTFAELFLTAGRVGKDNRKSFEDSMARLNANAETIVRRVEGILQLAGADNGKNANGIILAQEEERRRISREIHDGPAQTLASLTMRIDYCLEQSELPEIVSQELLELKDSVIRSLKDIRRFIFDLRPMALDDLGLIPTLEQFIGGFKGRTGVPVYVDVEGERVLIGGDRELAVFRVIQEASNNAIKHAQPSAVHIFLKFDRKKDRLSVVIKDDGKGFDVKEIRQNYGALKKLGLISMEERARIAGGEFLIVSDPGSGTVVSFWVPIV